MGKPNEESEGMVDPADQIEDPTFRSLFTSPLKVIKFYTRKKRLVDNAKEKLNTARRKAQDGENEEAVDAAYQEALEAATDLYKTLNEKT